MSFNKLFLCIALITVIIFPLKTDAKTEELKIDGHHGKLAAVMQIPDNKKNYDVVILFHGFSVDKNIRVFKQISNKLEKKV